MAGGASSSASGTTMSASRAVGGQASVLWAKPVTLQPIYSNTGSDQNAERAMFGTLVTMTDKLEPIPDLAEKFEVSTRACPCVSPRETPVPPVADRSATRRCIRGALKPTTRPHLPEQRMDQLAITARADHAAEPQPIDHTDRHRHPFFLYVSVALWLCGSIFLPFASFAKRSYAFSGRKPQRARAASEWGL